VVTGARNWRSSTLARTIFDQPAADEVTAQHGRVVASLEAKYPDAAAHLDQARDDLLSFTGFPREIWRQI
jgi:putative transposase